MDTPKVAAVTDDAETIIVPRASPYPAARGLVNLTPVRDALVEAPFVFFVQDHDTSAIKGMDFH